MNLFHLLGYTELKYLCPIKPLPGEVPRFWRNSPAHVGKLAHAKDIIIPDPSKKPLPVYAPASGVITQIVQKHDVWGNSPIFEPYLNLITVRTHQGEVYEIAHIQKDSCPFYVGSQIKKGQIIARTGANGYMTDVRHIHFVVLSADCSVGLKIRWDKNPVYL